MRCPIFIHVGSEWHAAVSSSHIGVSHVVLSDFRVVPANASIKYRHTHACERVPHLPRAPAVFGGKPIMIINRDEKQALIGTSNGTMLVNAEEVTHPFAGKTVDTLTEEDWCSSSKILSGGEWFLVPTWWRMQVENSALTETKCKGARPTCTLVPGCTLVEKHKGICNVTLPSRMREKATSVPVQGDKTSEERGDVRVDTKEVKRATRGRTLSRVSFSSFPSRVISSLSPSSTFDEFARSDARVLLLLLLASRKDASLLDERKASAWVQMVINDESVADAWVEEVSSKNRAKRSRAP